MFTQYKFLDYIIWCGLRSLIYQYNLIFFFYNYFDLPKNTLEFKEKIIEFTTLSNLQYPEYLPRSIKDLIPVYTYVLYFYLAIAILAILGFKVFQFISGVAVIAISCLYYHPLRPSTLAPGQQYTSLSEKYPWIDTILISLFGVGMIINAFWGTMECCNTLVEKLKDNSEEAILEEDANEKNDAESKKNK